MSYIVVIPARHASTRLPGKPLLDIAGKPMIQRVWEQANQSNAARVVVATDHAEIAHCVEGFGGEVCITSPNHPSGTDRLQEVAAKLGLADDEIVVNVQGDEPLIPPAVIDQVARNLAANPQAGVSTLAEPIHAVEDFLNPNIVKVVSNVAGLALYFSRAPISWPRDHFQKSRDSLPAGYTPFRHIGIYGYRVATLNQFVGWPQAPIEATESLEQLRFMWHGVAIHVEASAEPVPGGVDTPEDLARLNQLLATT